MIGLFDSGYGGLTILKAIRKKLPQYKYIYLGDNARCPYGSKKAPEIYKHTKEGVRFLFNKGARLIIIACNSASAEALRKIQQGYLPKAYPKRRVLGVLIPASEFIENTKDKNLRIGVIGTCATIRSGAYTREIKKINPKAKVFGLACPLLVPIIENQLLDEQESEIILKRYLGLICKKKINYLILGCTHYPVLYKKIRKILPKTIKIINPPDIVAEKLERYLKKHKNLVQRSKYMDQFVFYTTGDADKFKKFANEILNYKIRKAIKINL